MATNEIRRVPGKGKALRPEELRQLAEALGEPDFPLDSNWLLILEELSTDTLYSSSQKQLIKAAALWLDPDKDYVLLGDPLDPQIVLTLDSANVDRLPFEFREQLQAVGLL